MVNSEEDIFHESIEQENNALLAHVTQRKPLPPENLHWSLSNNDTPSTTTLHNNNNTTSLVNNASTKCITLDGTKYRSISNLNLVYCHSYTLTNKDSLVCRGINGGLCGTDVRPIEKTGQSVSGYSGYRQPSNY